MIRVNPPDMEFMMSDKFLQETGIGYHAGQFFKSGIICQVDGQLKEVGNQEENKLESPAEL